MRYVFGFLCVCALGMMPLVGCSETAGDGGSGGSAGTGGMAGSGGAGGMPECQSPDDCDDDNECTEDACTVDGECNNTAVADNTDCDFNGLPGLCTSGVCEDAMLCQGVVCDDDDNECTNDVCDPADGMCSNPPVADGTACDFGGLPGRCMSGVCEDAMLCEGVICEDTECKINGVCNPNNGMCDHTFVEDGTACSLGECLNGVCALGIPITVACADNVTSDVSIVRFDLQVDPGPIVAGSPFTADLTGLVFFPEFWLNSLQSSVPGGIRSVQLIDLAATVSVRSGATGADVALGADFSVLGNRCSLTDALCTGAPGQGDCPVIPSISNLCAQGFAEVPVIEGVPNSADGCTQPAPGTPVPDCDCAACEALDPAGCRPGDPDVPCTKGDQCSENGFCVNGDLSLALTAAVGNYTAGAPGETILFGWFDGLTPPVAPDFLSLPAAVFANPPAPVGVRWSASGLFVALQCLMGVDSGGPNGITTCVGGANDGLPCQNPADNSNNACVGSDDNGLPCSQESFTACTTGSWGECVNADCGPRATCEVANLAATTPDSRLLGAVTKGCSEDVECDDDNECTDDVCDPADGVCGYTLVEERTDCSFGDSTGVCVEGVCKDLCEGCEDTECKTRVCNPKDGRCDSTPVEDGTACSLGECLNGVCAPVGMPITVGCTNDDVSDVSIVRFDLQVDPGPIVAGSPFTADLTGVLLFPEFWLNSLQSRVPGGVRIAQLLDLAATVSVRSGATGDDVVLGADFFVLENRCDLTGVPCTGAPGQGDCFVIPSVSNLCAQGFADVPVIEGVPNSANGCTQPAVGTPVPDCDCATCLALDNTALCTPGADCVKEGQCLLNGFCASGDLPVPLEKRTGNYTADPVSGTPILFGWFDGHPPPTKPDGTIALPAAVFSNPTAPIGLRGRAGGARVALQCLMGVDSGGPYGVGVPDKASPTPDSLLITFLVP